MISRAADRSQRVDAYPIYIARLGGNPTNERRKNPFVGEAEGKSNYILKKHEIKKMEEGF